MQKTLAEQKVGAEEVFVGISLLSFLLVELDNGIKVIKINVFVFIKWRGMSAR